MSFVYLMSVIGIEPYKMNEDFCKKKKIIISYIARMLQKFTVF